MLFKGTFRELSKFVLVGIPEFSFDLDSDLKI